jgi:hypothetical protein
MDVPGLFLSPVYSLFIVHSGTLGTKKMRSLLNLSRILWVSYFVIVTYLPTEGSNSLAGRQSGEEEPRPSELLLWQTSCKSSFGADRPLIWFKLTCVWLESRAGLLSDRTPEPRRARRITKG